MIDHLPHDLDEEMAVLCSVILQPGLLAELDDLHERDFFDHYHRSVFFAVKLMHDAEIKIDGTTLKRQMLDTGADWDAVAIGKIANAKATSGNAAEYARAVRQLAQRRQAIELGSEIQRRASDPTEAIEDVAGFARRFAERLETAGSKHKPKAMSDVMAELAQDLSQESQAGGLPTGFPQIDELFGQLQRSELTTLGARPGGGKTTFGIEVATYTASRNRRVLYVSLEMGGLEFAKRLACMELGIDSRLMRQGNVPRETVNSIRDLAIGYVDNFPFTLWAPPKADVAQIAARARYQAATSGLDLLVIDHLQIVRHTDSRMQRYQQLGEITANLKALAKELEIPVLLQSQIARNQERPNLSSLRESGDIEQNSDNVWFLHRPSRDRPDVEFIVAKFRHGSTGGLDPGLRFGAGGRLEDASVPEPYEEFA